MKLTWYLVDNPAARLEGPCHAAVHSGEPWIKGKYISVKCTFVCGDYSNSMWNVLRMEDLDEGADLDVIKANLCVLAECKIGEMHGNPTT